MNLRTFQIISKYISNANNSRIVFDVDGDGAYADMKNNEIHMPDKVGNRNVFAVLALLMHESAHIAYSKKALKECVECKDPPDPTDMHIFNVVEDTRIDEKNFNKLSNVKSFYKRLLEDWCDYSKEGFVSGKPLPEKPPIYHKVLISALMRRNGFPQYSFQDRETRDWLSKNPLEQEIRNCAYAMNNSRWDDARNGIKIIKKMLNLPPAPPPVKVQMATGECKPGDKGDQPAPGDPNGKGKGKGDQVVAVAPTSALDGLEKLIRPGSMFSETGEKLKGKGSGMGEAALQEQTVQQFKELLNIKETKVVEDGHLLDTDNLTGLFTGDIDEVFIEDKYVKCKKSKILFLLDGSGSMDEKLLDRTTTYKVVADSVEVLVRILKEVQREESINVDYEIAKFESSGMDMLKKDTWRSSYYAGGGTNLAYAFRQALAYMQKDHTVEGKKIIIVITDGDVSTNQIEDFQKYTIEFGAEVSALVIGVGCNPAGPMALNVLGDNLILSSEHSDEVILEAIRRLL